MKTKTRPPHIRDLIDDDARVIALEAFRPGPIGHQVDRGQSFKLSDAIVRQYPTFLRGCHSRGSGVRRNRKVR